MGTVHGVYLKYVGLSALSYAGYTLIAREETMSVSGESSSSSYISMMEMTSRLLHPLLSLLSSSSSFVVFNTAAASKSSSMITDFRDYHTVTTLVLQTIPACILGYSTLLNGIIAVLFKCEMGMSMIGKNRHTGQIPTWSKVIFFPFHIPTRLYTYIHSLQDKKKRIPVASEVQPGWYVGGCYGHELNKKQWAGVIDLTVEFPETTIQTTKSYLSIPTWDGIPASPAQLEEGANFALIAHQNNGGGGDILIHCAHGRGRSTTMMCAALVKVGLYPTWEEAFEKGIKPGRPVCKLNRRMKQNLSEWQRIYVDSKKGQ